MNIKKILRQNDAVDHTKNANCYTDWWCYSDRSITVHALYVVSPVEFLD